MFIDKGIITDKEQTLISNYPEDIQGRLKEKLLDAKQSTYNTKSYDDWIDIMEQEKEISFNGNITITFIGELNIERLAKELIRLVDSPSFEKVKETERFKSYMADCKDTHRES